MHRAFLIVLFSSFLVGCVTSPQPVRLTELARQEFIRRALAECGCAHDRKREIECELSADGRTVTVTIPTRVEPDREQWQSVSFDTRTGVRNGGGFRSWSREV